jgi:tetratricopeptide (TPR) repeat protein
MSRSAVTARSPRKFGVLLALATTVWPFVNHARAEVGSDELEAFDLRGREIELSFENHTETLKTAFESLRNIVEAERPDLLPKLDEYESGRRDYGYQLIPKILVDPDAACTDTSFVSEEDSHIPKSSRFNWTITEARLNRDKDRVVDRLSSRLQTLAGISEPEVRAPAIEEMVEAYPELHKSHRFLDTMIQHNWLWQREISRRKAKFDRSTLIHDAIVERTLLREALTAANDESYERALQKTSFADARYAGLKTVLAARVDVLNKQIRSVSKGLTPQDYVRLEQPQPHLWIFHVAVNTDIEDDTFLREFKQAVEKRWCLRDGENEYRVQMELNYLSAAALYGNVDESLESERTLVPAKGEQIDLVQHCDRFPKNAAKLSSGAKQPHNRAGCLFVGPEDVAESTLAHEFGHQLGFGDEYVRGYRDLGTEGYEVLEILPDGRDIMVNADAGDIFLTHFNALVGGTYFRTGFTLANAGDHEAALLAYRKTIEISGDASNTADAYNNLGWSLKQLGRYPEAIAALEVAVSLRPEWTRASNNLKAVQKNLREQGEEKGTSIIDEMSGPGLLQP